MIENDLRRALVQHYESESLPDGSLERLLAQAERAASGHARTRALRMPLLAAAAGLVVAVSVGRFVAMRLTDRDPARVTRAVAAEILDHDRGGKPVQFAESSVDALRRDMPRLDFRLTAPRRLENERLSLVGARYCTIRGGVAAQIRFRDDAGRIRNLYLCPARSRLRNVAEGEVEVDGARVVIWREGDLVFGMARST